MGNQEYHDLGTYRPVGIEMWYPRGWRWNAVNVKG
jgi:hypothetical protein